MIKVSVLYPSGDGHTFDIEYYKTKHIPMVKELLGDALLKVEINKGISGATPQHEIPYLAMAHMTYGSVESFQTAFAPHGKAIMGDLKNFTNIEPVIQISELVS